MKRILVIGGTGNVGRAVIGQLLPANVKMRALARNPESAILPPEVELVRGTSRSPTVSTGLWTTWMRCSWCGLRLRKLLFPSWKEFWGARRESSSYPLHTELRTRSSNSPAGDREIRWPILLRL